MARPNKTGLDYFPLDVDFFEDDKIELITSEFGFMGEAVVMRLLCKIYKQGYFYQWGGDECLLFCKRAGAIIRSSQVEEVVNRCLSRSIFDNGVFQVFGMLTSRGIQKRYLKATLERKEIEIIPELWLIDIPENTEKRKIIINPMNNEVNPAINSIDRQRSTQSKGKKSKAKESKEKKGVAVAPPARYACDPLLFSAFESFVEYRNSRDRKPMSQRAVDLISKKLDELASDSPTKIAILEQSIMSGWTGVFELKNGGKVGGIPSVQKGYGKIDPIEQAKRVEAMLSD